MSWTPRRNYRQFAKWRYNIRIGSIRDSILSTNTKVSGQVCAIEDCLSSDNDKPSAYKNVDEALFSAAAKAAILFAT
jgi:hypothetical protein